MVSYDSATTIRGAIALDVLVAYACPNREHAHRARHNSKGNKFVMSINNFYKGVPCDPSRKFDKVHAICHGLQVNGEETIEEKVKRAQDEKV
jgi:hypothetical protein